MWQETNLYSAKMSRHDSINHMFLGVTSPPEKWKRKS